MRNLRQLRVARGSSLAINRLRSRSYLNYCIVISVDRAGGMREGWKYRYYLNTYIWI